MTRRLIRHGYDPTKATESQCQSNFVSTQSTDELKAGVAAHLQATFLWTSTDLTSQIRVARARESLVFAAMRAWGEAEDPWKGVANPWEADNKGYERGSRGLF